MVDGCIASRQLSQLLPHNLGRISHRFVPLFYYTHFSLLSSETGQLYLGVFSGPVEGILMIIGIYVVSGIFGKQYTVCLYLVPHSTCMYRTIVLGYPRLDILQA